MTGGDDCGDSGGDGGVAFSQRWGRSFIGTRVTSPGGVTHGKRGIAGAVLQLSTVSRIVNSSS